jgi:hypothetical protein
MSENSLSKTNLEAAIVSFVRGISMDDRFQLKQLIFKRLLLCSLNARGYIGHSFDHPLGRKNATLFLLRAEG